MKVLFCVCFSVVFVLIFRICLGDLAAQENRLRNLRNDDIRTILVHVHVPKAGGTAMALALSSACDCDISTDENEETAANSCHNCRQVKANNGKTFPYSVNRVTGWLCDAHRPLVVLRNVPCDSKVKYSSSELGLRPVFVLVLREPYERFVSESTHWCAARGQCLDWAGRIPNPNKKGQYLYYPGVNPSTHSMLSLYWHANLPSKFLIHNRHLKMFGGTIDNFNSTYETGQLGSYWRGMAPNNMDDLLQRTANILKRDPDVIVGIHERFADTLCVLEVLYGHLQRFDWDPNKHSHHITEKFNATKVSNDIDEESRAHDAWKERNGGDIELYKLALNVFDNQFQAALKILKTFPVAIRRKNAPHCPLG